MATECLEVFIFRFFHLNLVLLGFEDKFISNKGSDNHCQKSWKTDITF